MEALNGHYNLSSEKSNEMESVLNSFAVVFEEEERKMRMQKISKFMMDLERIKLEILIRLTREQLKKKGKVVVYVNYYNSIKKLKKEFKNYNPLILNGKTKGLERKEIMDKFQEHNNDHRLLIGNTKVGGIGINLHDTHGDFPRTMFIIPTYSILDMHQATGRIYRQGTKSNAKIYFIYSTFHEKSIINAIAKKTKVLKNITSEELLYPDDYQYFLEPPK